MKTRGSGVDCESLSAKVADMNRFSAARYLSVGKSLEWFKRCAEKGMWGGDYGAHSLCATMAERLSKDLLEIGCIISSKAAARFAASLDTPEMPNDAFVMPAEEAKARLDELGAVISDEMREALFLHVPSDRAKYYEHPFQRWDATVSEFPSTAFDIGEASACFALRRNTACVFHLMRVTGAGLAALGRSLNEPSLNASHNLTWDNILSRCAKELSEKFSGKSPVWQQDKEFYAAATAKLQAVKDAWRNPNAHEVGQKYTDEETEDIYRTVRAFMEQLATRLNDGEGD